MSKVGTIKILFLAANPAESSPLRLDKEVREIDQALRRAEYRDHFELIQHHAVNVADLQELLLRHQPHILHFSGHGSQAGEIVLESSVRTGVSGDSRDIEVGDGGKRRASRPGFVSSGALANTIGILKDNLRCVVLNACYLEVQAEAIAEHIDCVVGMTTAIGDQAAINFAASFYQGLGFGRDVKTAFDLGRNQIDLSGLNEQDTPQIKASRVDPAKLTLITSGVAEQITSTPLAASSPPPPSPQTNQHESSTVDKPIFVVLQKSGTTLW